MKTALITGATSGIGEATARLLAENKYNLIICGRRSERLKALQLELSSLVEVAISSFDVRDNDDVKANLEPIISNQRVDLLVNNAGNAHGMAPIHEGDITDWDAMIDINVKGLLYVTKIVVSQMVEHKSGQIINIGSIAGKEVYPNGNVYCASKHSVDAISNGMRMDLNQFGIRVSQISPGLVNTEFSEVRFKGDQSRAAAVYNNMTPLVAEDIAEIVLFMSSRPAHVNVSDVIVLPTDQASATIVNRNG
jgi:NADP-dependent 3-hydroxy acid dehydrogenase YdfG